MNVVKLGKLVEKHVIQSGPVAFSIMLLEVVNTSQSNIRGCLFIKNVLIILIVLSITTALHRRCMESATRWSWSSNITK